MDREVRIVIILLATLLSACGKRTRAQEPDHRPGATPAPEQVDPWVELQRLTYPDREAFMEHLAQEDRALASALVARVVRELAGPCSTLVPDADGCRHAYDDGWSEEYPDSWTLAAHPCVATHFVVGHDDLLVDADRDAVADDLVRLLGEDPGSYELLWDTVAKVPVSAAPEAWIWVVLHRDYEAAADEELRKRVWQHIAGAPTEARREACRHAARQRDDAEVAMRGAACLAELGDTSALPVRTPDLSIEELAFALHMLAFDETPTAAARIATFAHPTGVRIVVEGPDEEDPNPPPETHTVAPRAFTRWDLPFNRWHLPSRLVKGLECDPGPPATCRISRGHRYPGAVVLGQATTIQLAEHPEGGWAVVEAHTRIGDPLCEDE